jgi:hypothetical protein
VPSFLSSAIDVAILRSTEMVKMATMTVKQLQQLGELHSRFAVGTFSEMDVSTLLILLREKARGGPVLELAHSVAHSERDSGLFFQRMKSNRDAMNNLHKKPGVLRSGDVFSSDDFAQNVGPVKLLTYR